MKSFLPNIGDSELESDKEISLLDIPSSTFDLKYGDIKPKCPKRLAYASALCKISMFYIFGHEISHIRRGHFSLLKDVFVIDEFLDSSNIARNKKEVIEIDADAVSSNLCLLYLNHIFQHLDKNSTDYWIFENEKNIIELFGTSVSVATFLFSNDVEWMFNPRSIQKYPPSLARNSNLYANIGLFSEEIFKMRFDDIKVIFSDLQENFYSNLFKIISKELKNELKLQVEYYAREYKNYLDDIQVKRRAMADALGDKVLYQNIIT